MTNYVEKSLVLPAKSPSISATIIGAKALYGLRIIASMQFHFFVSKVCANMSRYPKTDAEKLNNCNKLWEIMSINSS